MRILVLGGNGFIGTNLVQRLTADGHSIRVYDRSSIKVRKQNANVEYKHGVLNDIASVTQALHDIDIVFHLISSSLPSTSNISPMDDIKNNLEDSVSLFECMKKMSIKKIVYISSGGTIYGESKYELINEDHPLNPNCSYGIVKLAVEKYLMMYARLYEFDPVILRASNPYGPWQGKIGLQGLITTVLTKVINEEPLEIWGDGEVIRDYLYIADLIEACICALKSEASGVFNIGSGVGYSINQVIKLVEEVTSENIEVKYTESRIVDLKKVVLDISKAKKYLIWEPKTNIKEGLKDIISGCRPYESNNLIMATKNHYVFFTRTLHFHGIGGMEFLTWDLMTEIVRSGQGKVTVVTTTIRDKPEIFEEEGVNVVAIQGVSPRRYSAKWWKLSANYFDEHLREDVFCVISVAFGAAGILFQRKKFAEVPVICQSHGTVLGETISK